MITNFDKARALPAELQGKVNDAGQLYGMTLAYYLAHNQPERWRMSRENDRQIYTLMDGRGA